MPAMYVRRESWGAGQCVRRGADNVDKLDGPEPLSSDEDLLVPCSMFDRSNFLNDFSPLFQIRALSRPAETNGRVQWRHEALFVSGNGSELDTIGNETSWPGDAACPFRYATSTLRHVANCVVVDVCVATFFQHPTRLLHQNWNRIAHRIHGFDFEDASHGNHNPKR